MRVRTTFRPDVVVEVDDSEYRDLKQQGLLLETTKTPKTTTEASAPNQGAGTDVDAAPAPQNDKKES